MSRLGGAWAGPGQRCRWDLPRTLGSGRRGHSPWDARQGALTRLPPAPGAVLFASGICSPSEPRGCPEPRALGDAGQCAGTEAATICFPCWGLRGASSSAPEGPVSSGHTANTGHSACPGARVRARPGPARQGLVQRAGRALCRPAAPQPALCGLQRLRARLPVCSVSAGSEAQTGSLPSPWGHLRPAVHWGGRPAPRQGHRPPRGVSTPRRVDALHGGRSLSRRGHNPSRVAIHVQTGSPSSPGGTSTPRWGHRPPRGEVSASVAELWGCGDCGEDTTPFLRLGGSVPRVPEGRLAGWEHGSTRCGPASCLVTPRRGHADV